MPLRILVFYAFVFVLVLCAFRHWFVSLCALIVLVGVTGNMPRSILGIQGLNAWNVLFVATVIGWLITRASEKRRWDMPPRALGLLLAYAGVVSLASVRMLIDIGSFPPPVEATAGRYASEYLINSLKYLFLGVLVYDGARTRRRVLNGLLATLVIALIYALLMARQGSGWLAEDGDWSWRRNQAANQVGMHPNELAFVLAWAFWGTVCVGLAFRRWSVNVGCLAAAALMALAMAKTACRGAYVTLPCVGLLLGRLRSKALFGVTLAISVVGLGLGAVKGRLMYGHTDDGTMSSEQLDDAKWSGRVTQIWPHAFSLFAASPVIGHGRVGLLRGPGAAQSYERYGVAWGHAHCAYLEMLVDSGVIGLTVTLALLIPLFRFSIGMARQRSDLLLRTVGAVGVAAFGTYLIMGLASQSFFPRVEFAGVWCIAGLVLRAHVSLGQETRSLGCLGLRR